MHSHACQATILLTGSRFTNSDSILEATSRQASSLPTRQSVGRVGTVFLYRADAESAFEESQFFEHPIEGDKATYAYIDIGGDRFTYTVERTVEREEIETPVGTFAAYIYSGYDADPSVSISLAPGIGVVRLIETGSETVLVRYTLEK